MDERAPGIGGVEHIHDRRERLPVHLDQLDGVLGALGAVGHDHRDDLADVARALAAEGPLGRLAHLELDDRREPGRYGAEER